MTDRRRFLQELAGASAGLAVLPRAAAAARAAPRAAAPLRILILGGTGFLGPHLVHWAVGRGHRVSIFTRGRREPGLFEEDFAGVEHLTGDRAEPDGLAALRGRRWDAVLETSGYQHGWTRTSTHLLKDATDRYLYVSSTGVYWPYHDVDIAEDGRVLLADDPPREEPSYGVMKARSENEVRDVFGERALIVRPGYIVGPGDLTDRWTYWPVRIHRGGEILVPGLKSDPVQYIDVRDLTGWMIRLLEEGRGGTFNAVGPARPQTMAEFAHGVAATTSVPLSWTRIEDHDWLRAYPLRTASDGSTRGLAYAVPWLIPEGVDRGHMRIDNARALTAGLTLRPLATTASDTVAWRLSDAAPQALRDQPRYVLTPAQEAAILDAWRRHVSQ
ncbi:MAG TPA: NAD-dependent epimerase/dehydratase family protein [Longimicrobiales bacterium]|nr:NAD-dependent epimerase/dehydratase family protein [Longimicrobiales bacterium]